MIIVNSPAHTERFIAFGLMVRLNAPFGLLQLGIILENSKPENEAYFFQKINKLVEHFQRVHDMQNAVDETVPVALIQVSCAVFLCVVRH